MSNTTRFLKRGLIQFCQLSLLLFSPFLFSGCDNTDAMVNVYDPSILKNPPTCLKLQVFPSNTMIEETMHKLYRFDPHCPVRLDISYRNGITCNSTFNVQTKSLSGFPSSYLNMEIRKGFSLKYSYYVDLKSDVTSEDLEEGFEKIREDMQLKER
jgi:hypothetical protein